MNFICGFLEEKEQERQLYLIMTEKKHRYCLYRIGEPQDPSREDEATIRDLGEPLLEIDESYPRLMAFAAVGSSIFMVGGLVYDEAKKTYKGSKKVFIYDTKLSTLTPGPKLNSRKSNPHIITLGSKIFVLSDKIYSGHRKSLDRKPRFEMLDTEDLSRGWSPLPIPTSTMEDVSFTVDALAAVDVGGDSGGIIVISCSDAGTYVFDVSKEVWIYVTSEMLPFEGMAVSFPDDSSLCYAYSFKSQRFSALRFCYGGNESEFQVQEIKIDDTDSLSPPLPPQICYRPRKTVAGSDGLIYFVDSGVDDFEWGNRYVKVSALQLSNLNGHKRQWLRACTIKKNDDEDVGLNKAESSKRGKKKKKLKGHVGEQELVDTQELRLTRIWRRSYFGGPICDPFLHVAAAFAM